MTKQIGTSKTTLNPGDDLTGKLFFSFLANTMVGDTFDLQEFVNFIRSGFTAAGLTQAEVDARIDALIPAARRIPAFAQGDAGEVVAVNAAGNGLEIVPVPAGPQGPAGPAGPQGPPGGTSNELSVMASLPAVGSYSVGDIINVSGVLYELVANTEDANVYRGTIAANAAGDTGFYGDAVFRFQAVSPFNMRVNFSKAGLPTAPANLYVKYHSGSDYADIVLTRSSGSDTSTTWGYVHSPGTPGLEAPTVGATFDLTVFSDNTYTTAQTIHTANRWERDDRNEPDVNPIALGGNTDRWPKTKLPTDTAYQSDLPSVTPAITLLTRNPGLTLNSTTPDFNVSQAPYYWSNPGIDLDDHPHGEFHCSLELTIAPVSDVNMGFVRNKANQTVVDRTVTVPNIVFASDLAQEGDYVSSGDIAALTGLNVFRQPVYSINTIVGYYNIILVHNDSNQVGYHVYWDGENGATGATFTAELRVTFTPSDTVTIPAKNSRGALQATSSILPTTGLVNGQQITGVTWTLASGSSMTANGTLLAEPPMRVSNNHYGWWIVSEVNGVEYSETLEPLNQWWRGTLQISNNQTIFFNRVDNLNNFRLDARSTTLPANTRVKFYMAVI